MSDYTDNRHRLYHGRMVAYVKPTGAAGDEIRVHFSSPWLRPAETTVKVR